MNIVSLNVGFLLKLENHCARLSTQICVSWQANRIPGQTGDAGANIILAT